MLGFSVPTSIVYFLMLWAVRKWRFLKPTSGGMALAGFLSAFYPTVCGYFPVYFMRWEFAFPLVAAQLLLLVAVIAISGRVQRSSG
jgi:hypothetical protein